VSLIPKQVTATSKIALVAINPGNARLARFDLVAAVRARSSAEPRPLGYLRPGLNRTEIEAQLPVEDDRTCECPIFPSRRPAAFLISVPTERVRSLFYPRPIANDRRRGDHYGAHGIVVFSPANIFRAYVIRYPPPKRQNHGTPTMDRPNHSRGKA
jgi:hypothetical protein